MARSPYRILTCTASLALMLLLAGCQAGPEPKPAETSHGGLAGLGGEDTVAERYADDAGQLAPLAGTRWKLKWFRGEGAPPPQDLVVDFQPDGKALCTDAGGHTVEEEYRIVGGTLIVNAPDSVKTFQFAYNTQMFTLTSQPNPDRMFTFERL